MAVQKNILVFETMTQFDGLRFTLAPAVLFQSDRMILSDLGTAYINGGSFREQFQQLDGLRFSLLGGAAIQILLSEDLFMQDAFINPNMLLTQAGREVVVLPTAGVNVRYTQAGREVVLFPTAGVNVRITQAGREVIIATPEAFISDGNYFMLVTEDLSIFTTDTLHAQIGGLFLKNISEHLLANLADQDTNKNVNVKKNQNIKATNFVTADTSLNHWQDAIFMTPFNAALSFTDSMATLADSIATKLPVTLTEALSDQTPAWADTTPIFLQAMQERFIQNLNLWQEFFAQPFLGLFAESNADQWQDSTNMFSQYFANFSDSLALVDTLQMSAWQPATDTMTVTDALAIGYGDLIADTETLNDSTRFLFTEGSSFSETLNISDNSALGYGGLVSDAMTQTDSFTEQLISAGVQAFETMTQLDGMLLGYGFLIADQLNMMDGDASTIGFQQSETLVLSDSVLLSYGFLLSDSFTLQDILALQYIETASEQMNMADAVALVEGIVVLLNDATPTMLEAAQLLFVYGLMVNDAIVFQEQLTYLYGLIVQGDTITLAEQFQDTLDLLLPFLADSDAAAWLDALILEMVYAPKAISAGNLGVLLKMVGQMLAEAEVNVAAIDVQPLDEIEKAD